MVDIVVQRGAADRPGNDIQEPLLATLGAAYERGNAEINRGALHDELTMRVKYQPTVAVGDSIRVVDSWQGTYIARVTGITHISADGTITTTLELWRPLS